MMSYMNGQGKFQHHDREQASLLLRKRLSWIGGSVGVLMALFWITLSTLFIGSFPRAGSPVFLIFLFLAVLLLGFAGMMLGRRYWRRIVSKP